MNCVREKDVESRLVSEVKKYGGICPKWVSPGFDGVPDRIVLMPGGRIGFVEVKAKGKHPRPLQTARLELLKCLGFPVFVLDDVADIEKIIDEIGGGAL